MKIRFAIAGIVWLACAAVMSSAPQTAAPSHIDLSKFPALVRAAIEKETKNATLKHVSKETEKGHVQYEVETLVNGRSRDLLIDPSGNVLEVEEEVALDDVPAPVRDALKAKGTVLKVESVTRAGQITYEAQVRSSNGKKSSVSLDAQGKPVKG